VHPRAENAFHGSERLVCADVPVEHDRTLAAARAELATQAAQTPEVRTLLEFLETSTRGLLR
jgi:acyl-[acyl carrier protein]--UDP-N-acetylglucosamine O-acyltransferase